MKSMLMCFGATLVAATLIGCGGDQGGSESASADTDSLGTDLIQDLLQESEAPAEPAYQTVHDPDAVYTAKDIPAEGSYLQISFGELSPDQLNRSLHRFKTENCTCGCPEDTIDECLVNDPACATAVELARTIMMEEQKEG